MVYSISTTGAGLDLRIEVWSNTFVTQISRPCKRRPPQESQGIPRGLFHDEAVRNPRRIHQNEGIPILPGWSRKGLAISVASTL
ncbi:hypothetical protein CR513_21927, partial [Mucuna pruriens]